MIKDENHQINIQKQTDNDIKNDSANTQLTITSM